MTAAKLSGANRKVGPVDRNERKETGLDVARTQTDRRQAPQTTPGERAYQAIHAEALRLQREAGCFVSFLSDVTTHDRAALLGETDSIGRAGSNDALWIARPCGSHLVWMRPRPTTPPGDGAVPRWRRDWLEGVEFARMVLHTFGPGQFIYRLDVERGTLRPIKPSDLESIAAECEDNQ